MDYRILGPLEVADGDRPVAVGGDRQRAVLGYLLLHRNEVVASERLVDELWGERPPPTAGKILQNYVSQLRRALGANGSDGPLETTGGVIGCGSTRGRSTSSASSAAWSPDARR